jgi:hypothetical protein
MAASTDSPARPAPTAAVTGLVHAVALLLACLAAAWAPQVGASTATVGEGSATDADGVLRPFKAEFALEWRGMNAASASLELTRQAGGHYTYVSRNTARGVFRAVLPGELVQTSRLLVEAGQVRPLSYRGDDGSPDQRRDVSLDFDWERQRVTGIAETQPVDLALQSGLQDIMSVQIALIVDLLGGRKPSMYTLVDKNRIKEYLYTGEGTARLDTVLGPLDTVIWSSRRPGSDRVTRVWYAPSLGFAPVRAERRDGEKLEWAMRLLTLRR